MDRLQYAVNGLGEEASELGQACAKGLRFGLMDTDPKTGKTNLQRIVDEYNDVRALINLVGEELAALGIPLEGVDDPAAIETKTAKFIKWGKRSIDNGILVAQVQDLSVKRAVAAKASLPPLSVAGTQDNG